MKCEAYPIITDIGAALSEVAGPRNASVIPMDGVSTSKGYHQYQTNSLLTLRETFVTLDYFDRQPVYYQEVSKIISNHIVENYDWRKIADLYGSPC